MKRLALVSLLATIAACGGRDADTPRSLIEPRRILDYRGQVDALFLFEERFCWRALTEAEGAGDLWCVRHDETTPTRVLEKVALLTPVVADAHELYAIRLDGLIQVRLDSGASTVVLPWTIDATTQKVAHAVDLALTADEVVLINPPEIVALRRETGAPRTVYGDSGVPTEVMQVAGDGVYWTHWGNPFHEGDETVRSVPLVRRRDPRTKKPTPMQVLCAGRLVAVVDDTLFCAKNGRLLTMLVDGTAESVEPHSELDELRWHPLGGWSWYRLPSAGEDRDAGYSGGAALQAGRYPGDPGARTIVDGVHEPYAYAVGAGVAYVEIDGEIVRYRW